MKIVTIQIYTIISKVMGMKMNIWVIMIDIIIIFIDYFFYFLTYFLDTKRIIKIYDIDNNWDNINSIYINVPLTTLMERYYY